MARLGQQHAIRDQPAPAGARTPPPPPNLQLPPSGPQVGDTEERQVTALPPPGAQPQRDQNEPLRALRGPAGDDEATVQGSPDRRSVSSTEHGSPPSRRVQEVRVPDTLRPDGRTRAAVDEVSDDETFFPGGTADGYE
eukprot:5848677-Prymnesium_polylepis.2